MTMEENNIKLSKIKSSKNFLCISNFNDDLDWLKEFDNPHIIYDKCFKGIKKTKYFPYDIPPSNLSIKYPDMNIRKGDIGGYNINEYLSYIIEHYDNLPDNVVFIKGNILNRHVSLDFLKKVINNKYFTSIEEWEFEQFNKKLFFNKAFFISSDGGWEELNNNWYLNKIKHPNKFFNNFNTFMKFIFKSYIEPKYIRFCPGANYIVPKYRIQKYNIVFYKNLKYIINYSQLSGESHILERALYAIWNSEYEVSEIMKEPFNENTSFPKKDNFIKYFSRKLFSKI